MEKSDLSEHDNKLADCNNAGSHPDIDVASSPTLYMTYKYTTTLNKQRINKILEMCQRDQINAYDIADKLNMRTDIARGFIRYMLENKLIYISEYKIFGKAWTRYYMAGNKPSVTIDDYAETYYMTAKQKQKARKKDVQVTSKKPRPDIASAWMFNPC